MNNHLIINRTSRESILGINTFISKIKTSNELFGRGIITVVFGNHHVSITVVTDSHVNDINLSLTFDSNSSADHFAELSIFSKNDNPSLPKPLKDNITSLINNIVCKNSNAFKFYSNVMFVNNDEIIQINTALGEAINFGKRLNSAFFLSKNSNLLTNIETTTSLLLDRLLASKIKLGPEAGSEH